MIFLPGGNGISGKVGNLPRVHMMAHEWQNAPDFATDFWFKPATDSNTASAPQLLSALGWLVAGTVSYVSGSGADFLSDSDKGVPAHILLDASGERLTSPLSASFGGMNNVQYIRDQLGWTPSKLIVDFVAAWTTASNADTTGGIGFVEAGGAVQTANDHMAMLTSDGTNFILRSGAATTTFASTVDNNWNRWRITLDRGTGKASFAKNGVGQGTTVTGQIAIQADLFPCLFGMAVTSNNDIGIAGAHVYYSI